MDRRDALKTMGLIAASTLAGSKAGAQQPDDSKEFVGILVDTTRCAGCRACEEVCAEVNDLPPPDLDDEEVFSRMRETSPTQYTVINRFEVDGEEIFVKKQCMHCAQPACASACLTRAMYKTENGPVIWREDKCMGCRFCMVSCPYDIPRFEYDKAVPRIRKCIMCWSRLEEGEQPACVENCPNEALMFGPKKKLIEEGRRRICENPDLYVDRIYGEREVGGTCIMYLASAPFEKLGFETDLGNEPVPELTQDFLYSVPIILALWPAFMLGIRKAGSADGEETREG